jgi:TolA-binding protein
MARVSQWLAVALTLMVGGQGLGAAEAEEKAFADLALTFRVGMWPQATNGFSEFVRKYPNSPRVPEAILFQARAAFHCRDFTQTIDLLTTNQAKASPTLGDEYLYWIGHAQFESGNFPAAATTFDQLVREFPDSPLRLDSAVREATASARAACAGGPWRRRTVPTSRARQFHQRSGPAGLPRAR